ncbi:hypothetical protein [Cryobacterium ruanii]|uniref:WxL domain-containing protein n=1 Tax=Cryobacterium ruanii TaxID=1259197 RepID=A0A4R9ATL8_9MICO|nr:hypothetical protein [Cryobacterium ruanii]TFD68733.1 hypothetical protein E3T47_01780 [Cryobacterium ruanii]
MAGSTKPGLIGLTSIALAVGLGVVLSPSASADTSSDTMSSAILGGALTAVVSAPTRMSPVILDGRSSHASVGRPAVWTITNARGSSAAWSLSVSATDFVSAPGTLDTLERTVAVENLTITPGIVTARTSEGADAAPTTEPVTVSGLPQALVWTSSLGKGTFTLTPGFSLNVPLNAYRSNFSGAIDGSVVNPFVSILTFTIA